MLRILTALLALLLSGAIFWAAGRTPIAASFAAIVADPWGIVTLIDLYVGFLLTAIVIACAERSVIVAMLWIVPLPFLGNVVGALWFAARGIVWLRARR